MKIHHLLSLIVLILTLTSMSDCDTEGPETTIKGTVTDVHTGEGYGNIPLMIIREKPNLTNIIYEDFDSVFTDNTGSYSLKFIPLIPGDYQLKLYPDEDLIKYGVCNPREYIIAPQITLGEINSNNFKVNKLVNLTIHLKNSSNLGYPYFSLTARPTYFIEYFTKDNAITKDTTLNVKVPRFTPLKIKSYFYGGGKPDFENSYMLNALSNDSTININN